MYPKWLAKIFQWHITPRPRPKLYPLWVADIIRWTLIIVATFFSVRWLRRVHWTIGLILAFPVYMIFLNLFGILTLPLYDYTTFPKNVRDMPEKFEDDHNQIK